MSAFDYSRFDKIVDSDEDEESSTGGHNQDQSSTEQLDEQQVIEMASGPADPSSGGLNTLQPTIASDKKPVPKTKSGKEKGRYKFEYQGRTIYEWEQSLEEVNIYVEPPLVCLVI